MTSIKDWSQRDRPGQWPLTGARVVLEPLDWEEHKSGLYDAVAAPAVADIWDYMPIGPFADADAFQAAMDLAHERAGWETLVIRKGNGGKVLGMSSYMRIREPHGSVEVGCVAFGRALRRTQEATEAMYLMMQWAFDAGYRRYEWKCDALNAPSRRAAERLGFTYDGLFKQALVYKGRNRDTAWYSILDAEWPSLKQRITTWLKEANFDNNGRQKRRLSEI